MKIRFILLAVSLLTVSFTSQAVTTHGLYEGSVPIVDKSSQSQSRGIRSALLQVLVKLTGKRGAAGIFGVESILNEPKRYLQQYEIKTVSPNSSKTRDYFLWAKFDANVLQSAMREYSIPIWSQERPSTLIWLVQNNQGEFSFPAMSEGSFFYDSVMYQAEARGINLLAPNLDANDLSTISGTDIRSGSVAKIKSASERYPSDSILTATVIQLGSELWQVDWLAVINEKTHRWETSGSSAREAMAEGIDTHADKLASLYSQQVGYAKESRFEIKINGINNFDAYANTLHYLESLNFISKVAVKHAMDSTITYDLVANGDIATLEQAASLGRILRPNGDGQSFQYIQ